MKFVGLVFVSLLLCGASQPVICEGYTASNSSGLVDYATREALAGQLGLNGSTICSSDDVTYKVVTDNYGDVYYWIEDYLVKLSYATNITPRTSLCEFWMYTDFTHVSTTLYYLHHCRNAKRACIIDQDFHRHPCGSKSLPDSIAI